MIKDRSKQYARLQRKYDKFNATHTIQRKPMSKSSFNYIYDIMKEKEKSRKLELGQTGAIDVVAAIFREEIYPYSYKQAVSWKKNIKKELGMNVNINDLRINGMHTYVEEYVKLQRSLGRNDLEIREMIPQYLYGSN